MRVAQISSLQNDLALALAAPSLRIEAPVPGQSFVGIEVPNDTIEMVGLRGVLESEAFGKLKAKAPLAFALGRDVSGAAICGRSRFDAAHLDRRHDRLGQERVHQHHHHVADHEQHARRSALVMIDPKMVELIRYNGLPHLYGKVETETRSHRECAALGDARDGQRATRSFRIWACATSTSTTSG